MEHDSLNQHWSAYGSIPYPVNFDLVYSCSFTGIHLEEAISMNLDSHINGVFQVSYKQTFSYAVLLPRMAAFSSRCLFLTLIIFFLYGFTKILEIYAPPPFVPFGTMHFFFLDNVFNCFPPLVTWVHIPHFPLSLCPQHFCQGLMHSRHLRKIWLINQRIDGWNEENYVEVLL